MAKSTPQTHFCARQTIPEPFLGCGRAHYPAERGHRHQGIPFFHEMCTWVATMFRWVVRIKVTFTWMAGPKVSQHHSALSFSEAFLVPDVPHVNTPGHPHEVKDCIAI